MKIKQITAIYFSPTGGTKAAVKVVADELAAILDCEIQELDITDYQAGREQLSLGPDTLAVAAVPVYGGRVPDVAVQKFKNIWGDHTPAVVMAVYGNRAYDDALLELKTLMSSYGFTPIAGIGAIAEHSIMREYGSGRPDGSDIVKLQEYARKIGAELAEIEEITVLPALTVPGNSNYREYNGVPLKPKASRECSGCGHCAAKCPVRAIPADDPTKTDTDLCISCMRCIAVCPNKARNVNKLKLAVAAKSLEKACAVRKENELFLVR